MKLMKLADELKYTTAIVKVKDLSNMNQIHELFQELQQEKIHVDVLVNNAGFGLYGDFINTSAEEE